MRTGHPVGSAARVGTEARIPETNPAWLAAMNAPFDDTPDTEQELADIAEAQVSGRFVPGAEVRRDLAAQRPG